MIEIAKAAAGCTRSGLYDPQVLAGGDRKGKLFEQIDRPATLQSNSGTLA